eukprot:gene15516-6779_t
MENWKLLGTSLTDSHGRIDFQVPEAETFPQGIHAVKMVVRGDHSSVDSNVAVVPRSAEAVVFSIDGSFLAAYSLRAIDPKIRGGAVDVVRHWQELGYLIIYVTSRLLFQKHQEAVSIHAAYGSSRDISVFTSVGLSKEQIFIVGKHRQQKGSANFQDSCSYLLQDVWIILLHGLGIILVQTFPIRVQTFTAFSIQILQGADIYGIFNPDSFGCRHLRHFRSGFCADIYGIFDPNSLSADIYGIFNLDSSGCRHLRYFDPNSLECRHLRHFQSGFFRVQTFTAFAIRILLDADIYGIFNPDSSGRRHLRHFRSGFCKVQTFTAFSIRILQGADIYGIFNPDSSGCRHLRHFQSGFFRVQTFTAFSIRILQGADIYGIFNPDSVRCRHLRHFRSDFFRVQTFTAFSIWILQGADIYGIFDPDSVFQNREESDYVRRLVNASFERQSGLLVDCSSFERQSELLVDCSSFERQSEAKSIVCCIVVPQDRLMSECGAVSMFCRAGGSTPLVPLDESKPEAKNKSVISEGYAAHLKELPSHPLSRHAVGPLCSVLPWTCFGIPQSNGKSNRQQKTSGVRFNLFSKSKLQQPDNEADGSSKTDTQIAIRIRPSSRHSPRR